MVGDFHDGFVFYVYFSFAQCIIASKFASFICDASVVVIDAGWFEYVCLRTIVFWPVSGLSCIGICCQMFFVDEVVVPRFDMDRGLGLFVIMIL